MTRTCQPLHSFSPMPLRPINSTNWKTPMRVPGVMAKVLEYMAGRPRGPDDS